MLAAIASGIVFTSSAYAEHDGNWETLGRESAPGGTVETDTIHLEDNPPRMTSVRVKAVRNGIYLRRVIVRFGNNEKQIFNIDRLIDEGSYTPLMDLKGRVRRVKRIRLEYISRRSGSEKSIVEIQGLIRPRPGYGGGSSGELVVVGDTTLRRGESQSMISLGRYTGPFTELALRAADYPVRIRSIKVFFANGNSDVAVINKYLDGGERTAPIRFDRRSRRVSKVQVRVSPVRGRRARTIELLARGADRQPDLDLPARYEKIARQRLRARAGTQRIRIGRHKGRFGSLVLRALDGNTYISHVVVIYGNGERDRIPVKSKLFAPDQTRELSLEGNRRISEIVLTYENLTRPSVPRRATPVIEVFGAASHGGYGGGPGHHAKPAQWVLLGTHKAAMFNKDVDVFRIGREAGRFSKIKVTAKKHDIRMFGMYITYGNGTKERVPISGTLHDGRSSQDFALKGRHRYIDHIAVRYRTKFNFKGSGRIELWGLKAH